MLDPEIKAVCQGYADGLNLYASRHPDQLQRHAWPARPEDLIAGAMHKLPMMFGMHNDIGRLLSTGASSSVGCMDEPQKIPMGSNFMAVGPSLSDAATRLVSTPISHGQGLWRGMRHTSDGGKDKIFMAVSFRVLRSSFSGTTTTWPGGIPSSS